MPLLRSILDSAYRAFAWVIRSSIDFCIKFCLAYWRAVYKMVESTPTPEWKLRQYVMLGRARSIEEARRKIDFWTTLGLALMPPMFTIVPLIIGLSIQLFDAVLEQLPK